MPGITLTQGKMMSRVGNAGGGGIQTNGSGEQDVSRGDEYDTAFIQKVIHDIVLEVSSRAAIVLFDEILKWHEEWGQVLRRANWKCIQS